jgi:hypothetical protein
MLETRRHTLDALRRGPALFAGLPGDEVDLDRLAAHLARRGIEGSIYATDGSLEGLLWIHQGAPGEAWFFEAGGQDAVLPVTTSRDLLLEIASRGGHISVFLGTPPALAPVHEALPSPIADEVAAATIAEPEPFPALFPELPEVAAGAEVAEVAEGAADAGVAGVAEVAEGAAGAEGVLEEIAPLAPAEVDPPAHPWPAILAEVMVRVVRHRGPRLAAQFTEALGRALEPYGGRVEGNRVVAPPLAASAWRGIVEAGCVPVVAVAGRAFVERTIAAAERAVRDAEGHAGETL